MDTGAHESEKGDDDTGRPWLHFVLPAINGVVQDVFLSAGQEAKSDAGDGGVDAGAQHAPPPDDEDRHVPPAVIDVEVLHHSPEADAGDRTGEPPDVQARGEKDCDHDDRTEVIGNGQGEQEGSYGLWQACSDDG